MKRLSEESPRKQSSKKRLAIRKKPAVAGVWPCKIDGCNKQFAREADLKRHQRTTKVHALAGFACPQCDASFTRPDALRRHQKSRHNGVIIEPTESQQKDVNDATRSSPRSRSRSTTPSAPAKAEGSSTISSTGLSRRGAPDGSLGYYRQHTAATTAYIPRHAQYPQSVGLPTSATRHHQSHWPPPPPWQGPSSHTSSVQYSGGPAPPNFYPSPYYRTNGEMVPPSPEHQYDPGLASSSQTNGAHSPEHPSNQSASPPHSPAEPRSAAPVIDPSLEAVSEVSEPRKPVVSLEVTQAAMKALLESTRRASRRGSSQSSHASSEGADVKGVSQVLHAEDVENAEEGDVATGGRDSLSSSHAEPPASMEHVLTEDGEPMLNPAELLTQESLASPPASCVS